MYYHKRPLRMIPSNAKSPDAAPIVAFPLPEAKLPKVHVSDSDAQIYRRLTLEVVAKTLENEVAFRIHENDMLDSHQWTFVKGRDRLRVYKRVSPEETLVPMVLGVGIIEGTVENALYGLQYKTTGEMRKTMAFVHETIVDAAVLATIDVGTDADPFRYMGLSWRVTQTPSSSHLVKNRDVCLLESRGISIDSHGHQYGYHVLKSVDVASFPPFHATVATRIKMLQCTIFRHVSSNTVSVYTKSAFDHAGSVNSFADSVLSVSKALDCAMAKRLTFLVLQGDDWTSSRPLDKRQTRHRLRSDKNNVPKSAVCSLCVRGPSLLTRHRTCKSCRQPMCSKCTTKVHVLATPQNLRIECCKVCVVASKEVRVDPREPCPLLTLTQVERVGLEL